MANITQSGTGIKKAFDKADASISALGVVIEEWKECSYGTSQEHQLNHSGGNEATSWSRGKVSHTFSWTLYMSEARKFEIAAGGNLLNLKPFQIAITYFNTDQAEVTDLVTCKFQSQGRTLSDDMGITQQYEMFVTKIQYGKV